MMHNESATRPRLEPLWGRLESDPAGVAAEMAAMDRLPEPGLQLRGLARLDSGDAEGARADFSEVLKLDAQNVVARLHRGIALFRLGDQKAAAEDFTGGPLFPHHGFLRRFLWEFWPRQFDEPALYTAAWPQEQPVPAPSKAKLIRKAPELYIKDRWGEAWSLLAAAREAQPDDREIRSLAAFFQLNRGEWREAAEFLDEELESALAKYLETRAEHDLPPPDLVVEYAWRLHQEARHHAALAVLSTIRPMGPDDYQAHILSALVWKTVGDAENAERCLASAFDHYFLDSWDLVIRPFFRRVTAWLESTGEDQASAAQSA